jgi:prepilin-type N-terminal cleavage/methylation domain-containing protein
MKKGFTLIELLVVVALFLILGAVVVVNLAGRRVDTDVVATTKQIATLLRQAQSDSMAQEGGISWGVHFANNTSGRPTYALFKGSYSTSTIVGQYLLPTSVAYQTSTLASGAALDIIFSQITGAASASTSIGLYMPNENTAFSSTISIASDGEVSY